MDVIGDDDTIREVYHLKKHVEDYEETLRMLKEMGHRLAPHIIIGHHFGVIKGEWRALEVVTRVGVDTIVLVILSRFMPPLMSQRKSQCQKKPPGSLPSLILNPTFPSGWAVSGPTPGRLRWRKVYPLWCQYHRLSLRGRSTMPERLGSKPDSSKCAVV
jgi:hypothetical protein